jgi:spoIIIJ-associated protein
MSDKRATLEVIAPTVDEALAKGLSDLGLPREAVEFEILDEGSRGLFGLGSRQARIRLTIKSGPAEEAEEEAEEVEPEPQPKPLTPVQPVHAPQPISTSSLERMETPRQEALRPTPVRPEAPRQERLGRAPAAAVEQAPTTGPLVEQVEVQEDEEPAVTTARETVAELLEKMKVRARVSARFGEPDDLRSKAPVLVDIHGNDLSILIGRQAETLNALQYITNLIVGKELGKTFPVIIDVEGYRKRRENQLRQLARRMAEQAVKTGRRQVLEPMPANERRIIHIELRDHPEVETESMGEEPRRKVTIDLKR